jgi:site-specific DNA recombinase
MRDGEKSGAVLYIRAASTDEAALKLESQEHDCRKYCQKQGWVVAEVFSDSAASGLTLDRPGFKQMLDYCRANQQDIGYVVVQDVARIARNSRLLVETVAELERIGCQVVSTNHGVVYAEVEGPRRVLDKVRKFVVRRKFVVPK